MSACLSMPARGHVPDIAPVTTAGVCPVLTMQTSPAPPPLPWLPSSARPAAVRTGEPAADATSGRSADSTLSRRRTADRPSSQPRSPLTAPGLHSGTQRDSGPPPPADRAVSPAHRSPLPVTTPRLHSGQRSRARCPGQPLSPGTAGHRAGNEAARRECRNWHASLSQSIYLS